LDRQTGCPESEKSRQEVEVEAATTRAPGRTDGGAAGRALSRYTTETKGSFKTSEFWLTVAAIAGILISAAVIKGGDTSGTDEFIARNAWLYVAIVVAAYSVGRGLAKSGTHEPYGVAEPGHDVRDNSGQ
jgi:uncharacterized membrane protein YcjF (UPF0283 family)